MGGDAVTRPSDRKEWIHWAEAGNRAGRKAEDVKKDAPLTGLEWVTDQFIL